MKPYETSLLVLVWGFAAGFWLWASGLDMFVQDHLLVTYNQQFNTAMRTISLLGLGRLQIIALLVIAALMWFSGRKFTARQMAWALPVLAVGSLAQVILKSMIGRPRPKEVFWNGTDAFAMQPFVTNSSYWSLPSGHATSTFLLATWLGLIFPRLRWPLWVFAGLLACSRFLSVTPHYVGDVVAGAVLGTAVAIIGWRLLHQRKWV